MGETQPEIRPARTEDAGRILALRRLCYRGEAELYDDHTLPPLTQILEGVKRHPNAQTVLVARVGEGVVGSVRARAVCGTCHVGRLAVHPRFRRRG